VYIDVGIEASACAHSADTTLTALCYNLQVTLTALMNTFRFTGRPLPSGACPQRPFLMSPSMMPPQCFVMSQPPVVWQPPLQNHFIGPFPLVPGPALPPKVPAPHGPNVHSPVSVSAADDCLPVTRLQTDAGFPVSKSMSEWSTQSYSNNINSLSQGPLTLGLKSSQRDVQMDETKDMTGKRSTKVYRNMQSKSNDATTSISSSVMSFTESKPLFADLCTSTSESLSKETKSKCGSNNVTTSSGYISSAPSVSDSATSSSSVCILSEPSFSSCVASTSSIDYGAYDTSTAISLASVLSKMLTPSVSKPYSSTSVPSSVPCNIDKSQKITALGSTKFSADGAQIASEKEESEEDSEFLLVVQASPPQLPSCKPVITNSDVQLSPSVGSGRRLLDALKVSRENSTDATASGLLLMLVLRALTMSFLSCIHACEVWGYLTLQKSKLLLATVCCHMHMKVMDVVLNVWQ